MWTLEQKQQYLKEHISEELREDFWNYIEQEVCNYDIENWSESFIIQLVNRFKQQKIDNNGAHETSFYHYQARDVPEPVSTHNILAALNHQTVDETQQQPQNKQPPKESAFALLDSIFQKKKQTLSVAEPDPQHFKTGPEIFQKPKGDSLNVNSFATNQFWQLGSKGHKVTKNNANADFASFDFWSQPSSANSSPQGPKRSSPPASTRAFQIKQEATLKPTIPSFDQLIISNYNKDKGPSPYTKKSNPDEATTYRTQQRTNLAKPPQDAKTSQKDQVSPQPKSQPADSRIKPRKVLYDGEIVLKHEFEASVKCFPATERSRLKDPELRVVIDGHQIIQRTFLMPDYAMYHIHVYPLDIVVKRNYEDFARLRDTLSKLFPGTKLSFLEKNSWFSKTNADFIKAQKVMLQFFLNDIIKNPEIRNSRILEDFLTLPDHKKIKRRFEQWEKLEAPKGIEDLCILDGRVQVNLSEQQRLYQENFKRYHTRLLDFLERYQRLNNTMLDQYRELDFTQNELVNLMKGMMEETAYFNERVYDLEIQRMKEALTLMLGCISQENKMAKFSIESLGEMILPFAKFEKENVGELEELLEIQEAFFKSYLRRSGVEKIEDSMPYQSDKISHLKTGVLEESKSLLVLKYQAGFLSNQACREGHRVIETFADKIITLFKDYGRLAKQKSAQMLEHWNSDAYSRHLVHT